MVFVVSVPAIKGKNSGGMTGAAYAPALLFHRLPTSSN